MRVKPYNTGTIKLTWISPSNYDVLKSEMFDDLETALKAAAKSDLGNNWLVFRLSNTDGKKYEWELLPYGKHKGYKTGMQYRDNLLLRGAAAGLMLLGGIYLFKILTTEKSKA